ncbi:hypothetical protein ACE83Q_04975 [Dellaglioa sp. P0083]|uniref:hypothetical protein n=1 Tax=Dellaglioa kimchii TaxID=3344667 RepID=UPI0038D3BB3F
MKKIFKTDNNQVKWFIRIGIILCIFGPWIAFLNGIVGISLAGLGLSAVTDSILNLPFFQKNFFYCLLSILLMLLVAIIILIYILLIILLLNIQF